MIRLSSISRYSFTGNANKPNDIKTPKKQTAEKQPHNGYGNKTIPFMLDEARIFVQDKTIEEIMNSVGMYKKNLVDAIKDEKKLNNTTPLKDEDCFVSRPLANSEEYAKYCHDGEKILNEYIFPSTIWDYADIGVDENELIKDVAVIKNSLNLRHSALESTNGIKYVGGDLVLDEKSKIKDLSSIEKIKGSVIVATEESVEKTAEKLKELKLNLDTINGIIITIPPKAQKGRAKNVKHKKLDCVV